MSVRGEKPHLIVYDEATDAPDSPYRLDDPPHVFPWAFLGGELVEARFSGVAYISMQHDWPMWKVRLEKIARERGVRMGLKAWLDPSDDRIVVGYDTGKALEGRQPDAGKNARVVVQLQVDDPELPEAHRVKTYRAVGRKTQTAIWTTLHAAGLVLAPEEPASW